MWTGTAMNVSKLLYILVKKVLGKDPHEDLHRFDDVPDSDLNQHQNQKSDPDQHRYDADPQD